MERPATPLALPLSLTLACVATLLLARIAAFGIWDPWELTAAETARQIVEGKAGAGPHAPSTWLASAGFRQFGVHEWSGRTPVALTGLLAALVAFLLAARVRDATTGVYAAIVTATTPLFLLNARSMLGAAPAFALQGGIGLCAYAAVFPRGRGAPTGVHRAPWLLATFTLSALGVVTYGALACVLPPLLAVTAVGLLSVRDGERADPTALSLLCALAAALCFLVTRDVLRDSIDHSAWIGGHVAPGAVPTWEGVLEEAFHGFAPYSALVPLAITSLVSAARGGDAAADGDDADQRASATCALWAAAGYGAQTLFVSRYGQAVTFYPVVALAVLVAVFLRDAELRNVSQWASGIGALLLCGLLLRDFALYPSSPTAGLPLASFEVPKDWNPKREWAAVLAPFGVLAALAFGAANATQPLHLRGPYAFVRAQWRRGVSHKLWLVALGIAALALIAAGALAFVAPDRLRLTTLGTRVLRVLAFVPLAIPIAVLAVQLVLWVASRLGRHRALPVLVAGAAIGVYVAHGFVPALSSHFSPREVFETYRRLAKPGEALGEYRGTGRAAAYYVRGKVIDLTSVSALVDYMNRDDRRWVTFPSSELASLNRAYRKKTGVHLVVADSRSAHVTLATNKPLGGKLPAATSFLDRHVLKQAPSEIMHRADASWDGRITLLGYDLVLPHDGYVGAGESFTLRWYFRCDKAVAGDYKVFLHIDGEGQRIHGDHHTVDGKYPVKLWDEGDIIVDEQRLDVPATYRGGEYAMFLGFYSGESRLPVERGDNDGSNRVRAGVLRIR